RGALSRAGDEGGISGPGPLAVLYTRAYIWYRIIVCGDDMASDRKLSNPLALAVLALLYERPMHPYEMAFLMRSRGKHHTIKLNYGSLYTVVDALQRGGLIVAQET